MTLTKFSTSIRVIGGHRDDLVSSRLGLSQVMMELSLDGHTIAENVRL